MRWFEQYRTEWIAEMLRIYGFINREHIERKFGISTLQASNDLQEFQKRYPDVIAYDSNLKCFTVTGRRLLPRVTRLEVGP